MSLFARTLSTLAAVALASGCVAQLDDEVGSTADGRISFEEFLDSVHQESDTGIYIVDGDIPIVDMDGLRRYYERTFGPDGALIVHQSGGVDAAWSGAQQRNITYCVSTGFGGNYNAVVAAMDSATLAWEYESDVDFIHLSAQDGNCTASNANVVFDVRPTSGQSYLARAFFPNYARASRNILIDSSSFGYIAPWTLTGILRHELGHTLGFRHEHVRVPGTYCTESSDWRALTAYDSSSVMHYPQCPGGTQTGDLVVTQTDGLGARLLYGHLFDAGSIWITAYTIAAGGWEVSKHPRRVADVNGDGRDDIIGFAYAGTSVSLSTGSGFAPGQLWIANYGYDAGGWRVDLHERRVADVNGDGKADIIGFGAASTMVSLSTGSGFTAPQTWINEYSYAQGWRVDRHVRHVADVNGDGKADIVGFADSGVYVSLSTGTGFAAPQLWHANFGYDAGGWRVDRHPRSVADVDGDGKADIIGFGEAQTLIALSTGSSFVFSTAVDQFAYGQGWRVNTHPRTVDDVNGDGRADIVGFGSLGVYVSLSTGSGFQQMQRWIAGYGDQSGGWSVAVHPRTTGDVNGDGISDVVGFAEAATVVSLAAP